LRGKGITHLLQGMYSRTVNTNSYTDLSAIVENLVIGWSINSGRLPCELPNVLIHFL